MRLTWFWHWNQKQEHKEGNLQANLTYERRWEYIEVLVNRIQLHMKGITQHGQVLTLENRLMKLTTLIG